MGERNVQEMRFTYMLLAEDLDDQGEIYGVRISSADGETAAFRELTSSQKRIQTLLGRLMEGCVTPATLGDVLEDWLAEV